MKPIVLFLTAMTCLAQTYSASKITDDSIEVVRLTDKTHETEVRIAPSVGNIAYQFNVKGKNIYWFPTSISKFRDQKSLAGNPFLEPWANRLDQDAFYANGNKYLLNPELKNLRRDPNGRPIHGLLWIFPGWEVIRLHADDNGAEATSRLEFWRYPELMAQFPFAHAIEMTYRLAGGVLEVRTRIENQSKEPMPLAIGFHPYFQLHDSERDQWRVHVAARDHVEMSKALMPTGEFKPAGLSDPVLLSTTHLDDAFVNLIRDADGRARFRVEGKTQKLTVTYGPKYNTAIVYAPPEQPFICVEPMTGLTNAFNLAHAGLYNELQSIPPGAVWEESYWIEPSGF
jgi:aldose 1-epimerase